MIVILFLIPVILMLAVSFYRFEPGRFYIPEFTFENYTRFLLDPFYTVIIFNTLKMAAIVTFLCLILGYPVAYLMSQTTKLGYSYDARHIHIYGQQYCSRPGWMIILGNNGIINKTLLALQIIQQPIPLLYNFNGVYIAMTQALLPLMILSIASVLGRVDRSFIEASQNLGAGKIRTFLSIIFPMSMPGVLAGSSLVLSLSVAWFITPALLGGSEARVLATSVYDETVSLLNWPFGSTIAVITVIISMVLLFILTTTLGRRYKGVFS